MDSGGFGLPNSSALTAMAIVGALQLLMGMYLFLWVFVFMSVGEYSTVTTTTTSYSTNTLMMMMTMMINNRGCKLRITVGVLYERCTAYSALGDITLAYGVWLY